MSMLCRQEKLVLEARGVKYCLISRGGSFWETLQLKTMREEYEVIK